MGSLLNASGLRHQASRPAVDPGHAGWSPRTGQFARAAGMGRYRTVRLVRLIGGRSNPTFERRLRKYAAATVLGLRVLTFPALGDGQPARFGDGPVEVTGEGSVLRSGRGT